MADKEIPISVKRLVARAAIDTLLDNEIELIPSHVAVETHPAFLSFPLELAHAKDIKEALKLQPQIKFNIARALDLSHKDTKEVVIRSQSTYLIVEVERNQPYKPTFEEMSQANFEGFLFGSDGSITLTSNLWAHQKAGMGFVGMTGSGKSNLIRLMMSQALAQGVLVYLIDYKGGDDFRDDIAPLCQKVAYNEGEALDLLLELRAMITARNEGRESKDERVLIVFDEIYQASDKVQEIYAKMCAAMRSSNVRTLGCSQRFGEEIKSGIKTNLKTRVVGLVENKGESSLATGIKGAGAELLAGLGDMLLVVNSQVRRIQVPRANIADMAPLLAKSPFAAKGKADDKSSTPKKNRFNMRDARKFAKVEISQKKGSKPNLPDLWAFYFCLHFQSTKGKFPTAHYFKEEVRKRRKLGQDVAFVTGSQVKVITSAIREYLRQNQRVEAESS